MANSLRLMFTSVLAALVLGTAGASAAAGPTLVLRGGHGTRSLMACGDRHAYTLYRRGQSVRFGGLVPAGSGTSTVRIKVKQCVGGVFVTRLEMHVDALNGQFSGSFPARVRGFFGIRAHYSGQKSTEQFLRIS